MRQYYIAPDSIQECPYTFCASKGGNVIVGITQILPQTGYRATTSLAATQETLIRQFSSLHLHLFKTMVNEHEDDLKEVVF